MDRAKQGPYCYDRGPIDDVGCHGRSIAMEGSIGSYFHAIESYFNYLVASYITLVYSSVAFHIYRRPSNSLGLIHLEF